MVVFRGLLLRGGTEEERGEGRERGGEGGRNGGREGSSSFALGRKKKSRRLYVLMWCMPTCLTAMAVATEEFWGPRTSLC